MAFDKPTRNRLASLVSDARRLISEEFTQQFQSLYGISEKGAITPLDRLGHLDDVGLSTAALLRERIEYLVKTHPDDREGNRTAVARLAREQAFTVLNRLAAIRMAEKRDIIVESVGKGYQSKGFKVFEQVAGSGLGDIYNRYRRYLFSLFDELAVDLGVLFDRRSAQGLLFPREPALQELLKLLNASNLDALWAEDETIGWVYQYYNDPAERKKMREKSAAPRDSYELAVRNQYFTPRYVVEFLTDNTLGRIWYEMTKGQTRLKGRCRYLVLRPTEIFLKTGEVAPENPAQDGLSREELLKQPYYIPYRPMKDPREIRLLDPACGSMHFGLYAFDLFEAIYEEAWDLGLETIRRDYPEKSALLCEIPRLIIEHNLHGIEIDPRAAQIACLSLWLRAQKSWQAQRIPADQRPRILRSNVVCAEPMPGSPELLQEFTATLNPPLLGQLVEKVFAHMQLAGEAGSLLKIEDEIATLVKDAKTHWKSRPQAEQIKMGFALELKPKQGNLPIDLSGISNERFWETAEEQIYAALHSYSEQFEVNYQRRLFAEDTARGFAFIDLCRKRYEAVLMNPPFGESPEITAPYMQRCFPTGARELYACFISRALDLVYEQGMVGVITSRTGLFLSSLSKWRSKALLDENRICLLADLGGNVLDSAMVEAAAYCICRGTRVASVQCFRVNRLLEETKKDVLLSLTTGELPSRTDILFTIPHARFKKIPDHPLAYWAPKEYIDLFEQFPSLLESGVITKQGLATAFDFRFLRLAWEVYPSEIGRSLEEIHAGGEWVYFAKGGRFSPFYSDIHLVVLWSRNGAEIKARINPSSRKPFSNIWQLTKTENEYFFKPGLTFPFRAERFAPFVLPEGCIFAHIGHSMFPIEGSLLGLLSITNSKIFQELTALRLGREDLAPHYTPDSVNPVPCPGYGTARTEKLAEQCIGLIRHFDRSEEITRVFNSPLQETGHSSTISGLQERLDGIRSVRDRELRKLCRQNDLEINRLYGLSHLLQDGFSGESLLDSDRQEISATYEEGDEEQDEEQDIGLAGFTNKLLSYVVGCVFGRWDIRLTVDQSLSAKLPDPFDPLPVCPPGMLVDPDGLPAVTGLMVSYEWLRARPDANTPTSKGAVKSPTIRDDDYPLRISWPGILVDDENHLEDVITRFREALEVIWTDRADTIEHEACELLGEKSLRQYFRRPTGFFADHLKRYSKSRRQAPIYWPLSTAKGSYTLWIYYLRLSDQTLHTALADFVDPKLKAVRAEIGSLRESTTHRNRLEELHDLEIELVDFRAEIERIIKLPWKPNLNDGVLITASPLWKLFRLPKWQKDLKDCWEKLEKGDYDWAHLAYTIWPKRVEDVCKKDRSIAIAHRLEHLCQIEPPKPKAKRGRKKMVPNDEGFEP